MQRLKTLVKNDKSLKLGSSMPNNRFRTPIFRLSYPHIFEKSDYSGKYQITMLFDTEMVSIKKLEKMINRVIKDKWTKNVPKNLKMPLHDGEEKDGTDGYGEGIIYASARSDRAPGICDNQRQPLEEDDIKAGDYCRATITIYAYDNQSKGVGFGLQNIQKIADGEAFGAVTPNAEDDFDDLEVADDDDDDDDNGDDLDV